MSSTNSHSRRAALALCAAGLAFGARAPGDEPNARLYYDVKPGTKLEKTFALEHQLALQSYAFTLDGVAQSSQLSLDLSSRIAGTVRDDVKQVQNERPTSFSRAFDEATMHVQIGEKETIEAASSLGGTSVQFTWIPASSAYGKCYDAREASEEFLQHLDADFDLLAFLPKDKVDAGAQWDVDARALAALFAPCGDLPWRYSKTSDALPARAVNLGLGGPLADVLDGDVKGHVRMKLLHWKKEADVDEAVLALEYEVACDRDQTELANTYATPTELYDDSRITSAHLEWKSTGKGTLVFDRKLATFKSAEVTGSEDVRATTVTTRKGGTSTLSQSIQLAGGVKLTLGTRIAPPKSATAPKKDAKQGEKK